jgi:hypothetical protein
MRMLFGTKPSDTFVQGRTADCIVAEKTVRFGEHRTSGAYSEQFSEHRLPLPDLYSLKPIQVGKALVPLFNVERQERQSGVRDAH